MAFKTKRGTWRVHVRVGGERVSKTFPNKDLARDFEAKLRLSRFEPVVAQPSRMLLSDFIEKWRLEYAATDLEPTTARTNLGYLRKHVEPELGARPLASLVVDDLRQLKGKMRATLKPKTVNNILGVARSLLNLAVEWELLRANPWAGVTDFEIGDQPFDFWEPDELDRFVAGARWANREIVDVVQFAAGTGLRLGEIHALRRRDIDLERRQVFVGATVDAKELVRLERTKNKGIGWVPLNDAVWRVVQRREAYAPDDPLFSPAAMNGITPKFRRLARIAGVRPIRFHDLRHTFASHLKMAGVDDYTVARLMRCSVSNVGRYAHLTPKYLAGEVAKLGTRLAPAAIL